MAGVRRAQEASAAQLSQGLHAATLCADLRSPWGGSQAPLAGREAALRRAAARQDPAPFDRATSIGNGLIQTCLRWPPTPRLPAVAGELPAVPTLLLAGERDLSTPLAWARRQAARTPAGRLVVVAGAGHSVQSRSPRDAGRRAALAFLAGEPSTAGRVSGARSGKAGGRAAGPEKLAGRLGHARQVATDSLIQLAVRVEEMSSRAISRPTNDTASGPGTSTYQG
jgi:hypothetical protein